MSVAFRDYWIITPRTRVANHAICYPDAPTIRSTAMSKGMDQKKNSKKKAQKTPDEKRAAKKAKKAEKAFINRS